MSEERRSQALGKIWFRRDKQEGLYDNSGLSYPQLFLILTEEVGEVAEAILDMEESGGANPDIYLKHVIDELCDTAAVAVQMMERALDEWYEARGGRTELPLFNEGCIDGGGK